LDAQSASRTALAVALMRARHVRLDPNPLLDDAWGDRLVPDSVREAIRNRALSGMSARERERAEASPESIVDEYLRNLAAYGNVILRSRFAEDALATAVLRGVRQYVLVGAGFDSFALRRPPFAHEVTVYEVDHPATQGLKLRRLAECGVAAPLSTNFVAADLGKEDLASALSRTPFRSDELTFFSWLGVSMYLTRDANRAALRAIARCGAPGSELVFTYLDQAVFEPSSESKGFEALRNTVASVSEPFVSGFDPRTLREELREVGLELVQDLDGPELVRLYDSAGINRLESTSASHIAVARVG